MALLPSTTSSSLLLSATQQSRWTVEDLFKDNGSTQQHYDDRFLQSPIPDYTSPPLEDAMAATPEAFRDDAVIEIMRDMDAAGNCTSSSCHILFEPNEEALTSSTGILLYCGGLVDPRAYSVLAQPLAEEGFTVLIPVFANDLAFGTSCGTGRLEWAQEEYPEIENWVLAGHSFGGVAAATDAWVALQENDDPTVAGVVHMASYAPPDVCGPDTIVDFRRFSLPTATITATEDKVLNLTRWEESAMFLSNDTFFVSIEGGNHRQFGSYDDSMRVELFGPSQIDGEATITPEEQWEMIVDTIIEVALLALSDGDASPSVTPSVFFHLGNGEEGPTIAPSLSDITETPQSPTSGSAQERFVVSLCVVLTSTLYAYVIYKAF